MVKTASHYLVGRCELMIFISRIFITAVACTIAWTPGSCAHAQSHENKEPWIKYSFALPNKSGYANLETRAAHPFLNEHQYRLTGNCLGQPFSVEPSMQPGGGPDLILEYIGRQQEGGPFIAITHASRTYPGESSEFVDLETGILYGSDGRDKHMLAWLKNLKRYPIGKLNSHSDFYLPDGSVLQQTQTSEPAQGTGTKTCIRTRSDKTMKGIFAKHRADFIKLANMVTKEKRMCRFDVLGSGEFVTKDFGTKGNPDVESLNPKSARNSTFQYARISRERFQQYIYLMEKIGADTIERDIEKPDVVFRMTRYGLDGKSLCYVPKGTPQYRCSEKLKLRKYLVVTDTEKATGNPKDLHLTTLIEPGWYILRNSESRKD